MFDIEIDVSEVVSAWNEALVRVSDGITRGVTKGVIEGADAAKSSHAYQDHTGDLTRSIRGRVESSGKGGAAGVIEATAKHASYVENGTAPHDIWPKEGEGFTGPLRRGQSRRDKKDVGTHRTALRWSQDGTQRFARMVHHPGSKPYPFMGPALEKCERVILREVEIGVAEAQKIMERE